MSSLYLSLTPDEIELLYSTLVAACLQYENEIEAADDAQQKSRYRNIRLQTMGIIEKLEKLRRS